MLGGLTFGFFTGSAAVFQSMRPTQGGLMKIIFADEDGLWRLAALGNRTGLTDKRYAFAYYEACASLIGATAGYHATMQEWALGPRAYALSIGMAPPAIPASAAVEVVGETKLCPDCGETVKAMARVCRFCRYEFRSDGPDPASPHEPEAATAALDQMDLNEAAALFEYTYVAIEDIVTDDLAPAVTPVVDLDALGLWGETSLAPLREHREAIARLRIGIPEIQDLADRIDAALVAYIHAATLARDRSPDAVQALTAATASWQHVQAKVG
jgi:rubredoxin